MGREHKLKELNKWFNENKKSYNISGITYDGVLVKTDFFNSINGMIHISGYCFAICLLLH